LQLPTQASISSLLQNVKESAFKSYLFAFKEAFDLISLEQLAA